MDYVRLTTMASVLGVTDGWLRGLVYQRVLDDERENPVKGSPYIMHIKQTVQALIAKRLREAHVGYDTIRLAVDKFDIDRAQKHTVKIAEGIDLVFHKSLMTLQARFYLKQANTLEYGEEREAA